MNTDIAKIEGFEKASENSKQVGIKNYFEKKVIDRMQFLRELRASVPELDLGSVEIEGSAAGTLHRTWMDVKAFFAEDNDEAMLEEAVRGDKAAINDYDNALAEVMMPHRLKEIIRAQKEFLQNDLETTEILEHHR